MSSASPTAFISYCRQDGEFATRLAQDLKAAGARAWLDTLDIPPGTPWDRTVESALRAAPCMIVILSPVSVASDNVLNEISFALGQGKAVIPVLYKDCDVPLQIHRVQRVDFRSDYARGLTSLLTYLGTKSEHQQNGQLSTDAPIFSQHETDSGKRAGQVRASIYGGILFACVICTAFYLWHASKTAKPPALAERLVVGATGNVPSQIQSALPGSHVQSALPSSARATATPPAPLELSSTDAGKTSAISKFHAASDIAMGAAEPLLADLRASCLRRKNLEQRIGSFNVIKDDPGCTAIGIQSDAAVATAEVLADYFAAINSLATTGTFNNRTNASVLVSQTGPAWDEYRAIQPAFNSIAKFLSSASTGAHQQHRLNSDLSVVSANVGPLSDYLVKIVQIYATQLDLEDTRLAEHYKDFSLRNASGDSTLLRDQRWHADEQVIAAKKDAAANLISALYCIKKGSADLAKNGKKLNANELLDLLDPSTTQLQTFIPRVQKAF